MIRLDEKQYRAVKKMTRAACANNDCGNCLLLDDGETCVCVQSISYSLLCRYFREAVLPADRQLCEQITRSGETDLKALDNEDKYTPDTNFKGWMYTIMRNIFINNYRKVVRDQTFVDQTDNLYHLNLPQDTSYESTERAYDLKEMHRVVNKLPKEYRVPFAMHVSGFKYREIAEKLNLPLGTVKSRIFFTRQKLQEDLKDFR